MEKKENQAIHPQNKILEKVDNLPKLNFCNFVNPNLKKVSDPFHPGLLNMMKRLTLLNLKIN